MIQKEKIKKTKKVFKTATLCIKCKLRFTYKPSEICSSCEKEAK